MERMLSEEQMERLLEDKGYKFRDGDLIRFVKEEA